MVHKMTDLQSYGAQASQKTHAVCSYSKHKENKKRKVKKSKKLSKLYLSISGNCSGLSAQEALQEDFSAT